MSEDEVVVLNLPALKWNPKDVLKWGEECEKKDRGRPIFRTRFYGEELSVDGKFVVMGVCYGGKDTVGSVLFFDVPKEEFLELKRRSNDWRYLKEKFSKVVRKP